MEGLLSTGPTPSSFNDLLDAYSYEMFPPFNPPYLSNAVEILFHLASSPHPHLLLPNWRLLPNILNYTVQCSAVLHGGVLRSAVQFSIVQCSALHQCSVVQCSALQQCSAVQCSWVGVEGVSYMTVTRHQ